MYKIVNGEIKILKYYTHGLGHLKGIGSGKDEIDPKQIWKDILNNKFENYSDKMGISQITITKPSILKRFREMNKDKPLSKQIRPFNFFLIGSETNGVIPCLPFRKDIEGIQYLPFIDYKTGKIIF